MFVVVNVVAGAVDRTSALGETAPFASVVLLVGFAVAHGIRRHGAATIGVFFLLTFAISWSYETLSILTGFPFGNYEYSSALGPKLWLVPVLIMPAYFAMGYLSQTMATVLAGATAGQRQKRVMVPVLAAVFMVMWDLSFDPAASTLDGSWMWESGGPYFGVPISNFAGWFLCVLTIFISFEVYVRRVGRSRAGTAPTTSFLVQPALVYGAVILEFVTLAVSIDDQVIATADGRMWHSSDIAASLAMISVLTMGLVVLLSVLAAASRQPAPSD